MNLVECFPPIASFRSISLDRFVDPEVIFSHLYRQEYAALFCGKGNRDNSRYAYIGINSFLRIRHDGKEAIIRYSDRQVALSMDPFHLFEATLTFYSMQSHSFPISVWGAMGYFSYDAAHCIERLPKTTIDDLEMPIMEMAYYRDFFIFDYQNAEVFLIQADTGKGFSDPQEMIELFGKRRVRVGSYSVESPQSCCSREDYISLVKKIVDYIKKGDVYEVNLSHRFEARYQGDPYGLFLKLYQINPAPFSAYLNFGDNSIISSSPERFLRAEGDRVETRPIKGTIRRGEREEEDLENQKILANSMKDDAELSMIVDLLRNDLGKVCEYGSVRVKEHKRIEGFSNVWHLVSIVEGKIRGEENYSSLIRACFPGGSITGCPKIRSMEIIDELEKYARNLYTGMIFIANDARLDSSIVIRTIVAKKRTLYFSVGGAVVYDSSPEREYEETLEKAQSIMKAI